MNWSIKRSIKVKHESCQVQNSWDVQEKGGMGPSPTIKE